ncbi:roundabout homolog 3 isoform X2 [Lates japonicus]|uniref:Roundabout homolog 3 isoform X2 n=1 Tax=Lates japonicus TaxID=270547 RepID=A0AAD3MEQ9_LATJO|nr:roundabout homolog 3 isoform X2 [Lates japonicus]
MLTPPLCLHWRSSPPGRAPTAASSRTTTLITQAGPLRFQYFKWIMNEVPNALRHLHSHQSTVHANLWPPRPEPHDLPATQLDGQQLSRYVEIVMLTEGYPAVQCQFQAPLTLHPTNPVPPANSITSLRLALQCQCPAHRCLHSQGPARNEDNAAPPHPQICTPPNQNHEKKVVSKSSAYRRDIQGGEWGFEFDPDEDMMLVWHKVGYPPESDVSVTAHRASSSRFHWFSPQLAGNTTR